LWREAVRQADRGQEPPPLIGDVARHLDSFAPQFGEGGLDVVADQVKLMPAVTVSGMHSQLGRGQSENQPSSARVDR
jgi:hypothetical protein